MLAQYHWADLTPAQQAALLARPRLRDDREQAEVAQAIIDDVRANGDAALFRLTEKFDGARLESVAVTADEFSTAENQLSAQQRDAIKQAQSNIEAFHRAQLSDPIAVETTPGVHCERVTRPLSAVGLYVPAGTAPLPSTALMLAIPAKLAGCPTRVLCSPPRADGSVDPAVLVAAQSAGISQVFKLGGVQAIAAMAYGTTSVPKVDKVFGPGNSWVTLAKILVSRDADGAALDMPAGPSEVLVIADAEANPLFVATDLLSQAEHGPDSQVLLVSTDTELAKRVAVEIKALLPTLPRREVISQALEHSAAIVVADLDTAFEVSNRYAPEHLIVQVNEPRRWLDTVIAAGSVFLGPWSPEAIGDYCSGTNHVLPTYGFARSYGSLGTQDFQRAMTVQELTPDGLRQIGPVAETLASLEGLDAHRIAVASRLEKMR
jgi:histidinol dehydrogenase